MNKDNKEVIKGIIFELVGVSVFIAVVSIVSVI